MRVAFLVTASSVVASAVVAFVACSSSSGAGLSSNDDGGSSGSSGNGSSGDNPGAPDAGDDAKRAQNGCLLFGTDILEGTTAENLAAAGKIDWTSPSGALTPADNQYSQVVLGDGQESATLKISGYNLQVPATADVWGIIVELKRRTLTDGGVLQTSKVAVSVPNTGFKFDEDTFFWPRSLVADGGYGSHSYGQEVDSWGVNLQPSDFGAGFFTTLAVQKSADGGAPGPITGSVDSLRVQVWYATGTADTCQK